jgi:hypothetical protein
MKHFSLGSMPCLFVHINFPEPIHPWGLFARFSTLIKNLKAVGLWITCVYVMRCSVTCYLCMSVCVYASLGMPVFYVCLQTKMTTFAGSSSYFIRCGMIVEALWLEKEQLAYIYLMNAPVECLPDACPVECLSDACFDLMMLDSIWCLPDACSVECLPAQKRADRNLLSRNCKL